ncbi:hypothetical protein DVH05_027359 [Phytophthora capsici]|nr:hypothetical protein DVH05_027359 [Phytophthora capsici]
MSDEASADRGEGEVGDLDVCLGLSPDTLNALLDEAKTRTYTPVFKDVSDDNHDTYWEQSCVHARPPSIGLLRVAIISVVTACLDPAWLLTVFSFLRSTPGGEEQEAHQDYPESVITEASKNKSRRVPASMILALEEGTSLRVYNGCFTARDDSKSRVVQIPVRFCIIFRGGLIHNGLPYDVVNHRIHCYLSFRGLK